MKLLILPLVALVICSCRTQFKNVRTFPVDRNGCRAFLVVEQDWHYPLGYIDGEGNLRMITADLNTLGQIEAIRPSPGGRRVLIESYGEGHQFISVYDIQTLIQRHVDSEMIPALGTLDPYPGAFAKVKWVDDDTLEFESVSDFHEFDSKLRRGRYSGDVEDGTMRTWRWRTLDDTFTEMRSQRYLRPARMEVSP